MEKVDQDYADELILHPHSDAGSSSSQEDFKLLNSLTYDQIQSMATSLGKGERTHDMEVTMQFLQVKYCIFLVLFIYRVRQV